MKALKALKTIKCWEAFWRIRACSLERCFPIFRFFKAHYYKTLPISGEVGEIASSQKSHTLKVNTRAKPLVDTQYYHWAIVPRDPINPKKGSYLLNFKENKLLLPISLRIFGRFHFSTAHELSSQALIFLIAVEVPLKLKFFAARAHFALLCLSLPSLFMIFSMVLLCSSAAVPS